MRLGLSLHSEHLALFTIPYGRRSFMRFFSRKSAMSKIALAAFAFGLAGIGAAAAQAESVTFTTQGTFFSADGLTNYGSSVDSVGGHIHLAFDGIAAGPAVDAPTFTSFGTFTVTRDQGFTGTEGFSDKFVLKIIQTDPTNGSASFPPAIVAGTIKYDPSSTSSLLTVSFDPASVATIGRFIYTPDDESFDLSINAPSTGPTSLQGVIDVTSVPSPVAASAGCGLLGILALSKFCRRSRLQA